MARVLVAMAAGGVFLVPWLPSMLYQAAHTGTPWASVVRPTTMVTETLIRGLYRHYRAVMGL